MVTVAVNVLPSVNPDIQLSLRWVHFGLRFLVFSLFRFFFLLSCFYYLSWFAFSIWPQHDFIIRFSLFFLLTQELAFFHLRVNLTAFDFMFVIVNLIYRHPFIAQQFVGKLRISFPFPFLLIPYCLIRARSTHTVSWHSNLVFKLYFLFALFFVLLQSWIFGNYSKSHFCTMCNLTNLLNLSADISSVAFGTCLLDLQVLIGPLFIINKAQWCLFYRMQFAQQNINFNWLNFLALFY